MALCWREAESFIEEQYRILYTEDAMRNTTTNQARS